MALLFLCADNLGNMSEVESRRQAKRNPNGALATASVSDCKHHLGAYKIDVILCKTPQ